MKNFFSKFFKKEKIVDDQSIDKVVSACISLMVEVSIADQSIDDSEIESLKNIPIWLFHGDKDKVVPVENSQRIYDRLAPINPKIKLTIYDGVNHNSWDATYDNDNIYDWLLENKK